MQRFALGRSEGRARPRGYLIPLSAPPLSWPNWTRTEARVLTSSRPTLCRPNADRNRERRTTDNRQRRAGRPIEILNSLRLERLDKLRKPGGLHRVFSEAVWGPKTIRLTEIGEPAQTEHENLIVEAATERLKMCLFFRQR